MFLLKYLALTLMINFAFYNVSHAYLPDQHFSRYEMQDQHSPNAHPPFNHSSNVNAEASIQLHLQATGTNTECSSDTASLYSGHALINHLISLDAECMSYYGNFYAGNTNTFRLYQKQNMIAVAQALSGRATSYTPTTSYGIHQLIIYLRAGFYVNFYYAENFDYTPKSSDVFSANLQAASAFSQNQYFRSNNTDHAKILFDWVYYVDSANLWLQLFTSLQVILDDMTPQRNTWHQLNAYNAVFFALFRASTDQDFRSFIETQHNGSLTNSLKEASLRDYLLENGSNYQYLVANAALELGRLLGYSSLKNSTYSALSEVFSSYERLSPIWISAARSLNLFGNCQLIPGTCKPELETQLKAMLFPNSFSWDNGLFVVHTPLAEQDVLDLYHASKQVKSQFFRLLRTTQPLAGDTNSTLHIYLYGSQKNYHDYHPFLFDLDTNNGGIYIERDGTFFTYHRTTQESVYSLEELFRHEYAHYLMARYAIHGLFWESDIYDNERLTWIDEGIAEFLAGSTQSNNVQPRHKLVSLIKSDGERRMNLSEFTRATYSGNFNFYRYAGLFFNFLYDQNKTVLYTLIDNIRENRISTLDSIVTSFRNEPNYQQDYTQYLNTAVQRLEQIDDPFTPSIVPKKLELSDAAEVESILRDYSDLEDATCLTFVSTHPKRFLCQGQLRSNTPIYATEDFGDQLNRAIQESSLDSHNNWRSMNCHFGSISHNINHTTAEYHCEGALKSGGAVGIILFLLLGVSARKRNLLVSIHH